MPLTAFTAAISLLLVLLVTANRAAAQQPLRIQLNDSVAFQKNSRFAANHITLSNEGQRPLTVRLLFPTLSHWRMMAPQTDLQLLPNEKQVLPLNLVPQPQAAADWTAFRIGVLIEGRRDTLYKTFWAKPFAIARYQAKLYTQTVRADAKQRSVTLQLYLNNTGNVANQLRVSLRNPTLLLNQQHNLWLQPQQDTLLLCTIPLSAELLRNVMRENISIRLADTAAHLQVLSAEFIKSTAQFKAAPSAYATLPLELENGYIQMDGQLSYYAALRGQVALSKNQNLSVSYRSKEYGIRNQLQNHVFSLNYTGPRLTLYLGQMGEARSFASFGSGARATYVLSPVLTLFGSTTLFNNNPYFTNRNGEAGLRLRKSKLNLEHTVAANFDPRASTNSYLVLNRAVLQPVPSLQVDVMIGGGQDVVTRALPRSRVTKPGLAWGYSVRYQPKQIRITSSIYEYSAFYPGLNRGLKSQSHSLFWTLKKVGFNLFYQSNQSRMYLFRDTVYNTDLLNFNTARYGLQVNANLKATSIELGVGQLQQLGDQGTTLTNYRYVETGFALKGGKNWSLRFNSFNGFGHANGKSGTLLWLTNSMAGVYHRNASLAAIYTQAPLLSGDSTGKSFLRYEQTANLMPALNFFLWKRVRLGVHYSLARSLYDDQLSSFAGGNINYSGKGDNFSVNFSTSLPLQGGNQNAVGLGRNYMNLSLRKKLAVPLLFKRKYHNLSLLLFNDRNTNGVLDKGEEGLRNLVVKINGVVFVSDADGRVGYRNIPPGNYAVDLTGAAGVKGLLPSGGFLQTATVQKSGVVSIPFKKSRQITGSVNVVLDSTSNVRFSGAGLKVTAQDSTGASFAGLTDENGSFFLNVPAGVYLVSLNPDAFDDKIKPLVMAYTVDLTHSQERSVQFSVQQQKRKVRILNTN